MILKKYAGVFAALLVIAGGLSPMLHLPIIGNWNYFDIDLVLASLVFSMAGLALIASGIGKAQLLKICGYAILALILFTLVAVFFKVNNYFSFLPFKKLAAAASRTIHYRWTGWVLMFMGALIMIFLPNWQKKVR
ncbi:MAG: hypothetical protein ABI390_07445 [Daejeonella sp.]